MPLLSLPPPPTGNRMENLSARAPAESRRTRTYMRAHPRRCVCVCVRRRDAQKKKNEEEEVDERVCAREKRKRRIYPGVFEQRLILANVPRILLRIPFFSCTTGRRLLARLSPGAYLSSPIPAASSHLLLRRRRFRDISETQSWIKVRCHAGVRVYVRSRI